MSEALNDAALKQLFFDARTFNKFQSRPVEDATLHALVDLMKWGPTSMNGQPGIAGNCVGRCSWNSVS